jgi:hypothetical protein
MINLLGEPFLPFTVTEPQISSSRFDDGKGHRDVD